MSLKLFYFELFFSFLLNVRLFLSVISQKGEKGNRQTLGKQGVCSVKL